MATLNIDTLNLDYGIIYVLGNPKQTHNLKWFATMIEPMIRPLSLEWVETCDVDHTLIVARRFNVGNIGKYATVQLHLNQYGRSDSYSLLAAVHAFSDCLQDVMDASEGDVIINERDYSDHNEPSQGKWGSTTQSVPVSDVLREHGFDEEFQKYKMPQDHTRVERQYFPMEVEPEPSISCEKITAESKEDMPSLKARIQDIRAKLKRRGDKQSAPKSRSRGGVLYDITFEDENDLEEGLTQTMSVDSWTDDSAGVPYEDGSCINKCELDFEVEELQEFNRIEAEFERDVKDLRARIVAFITKYHQDPQQMMTTLLEGKVLLGSTPGRMLVNGDMKVVLPEYDEMEIKMPAMSRTLYILFMKLRKQGHDGIVLRNIDEYRDDIIDIYSLVKPGADEDRVVRSVDNLCDPYGDSLHQAISRVNRCINSVITDKKLVEQYIITGTRGETYGIALDPELLELPRAVTGIE